MNVEYENNLRNLSKVTLPFVKSLKSISKLKEFLESPFQKVTAYFAYKNLDQIQIDLENQQREMNVLFENAKTELKQLRNKVVEEIEL